MNHFLAGKPSKRHSFSLPILAMAILSLFAGCDPEVSHNDDSTIFEEGQPGQVGAPETVAPGFVDFSQDTISIGSFNIQIFGRAKLAKTEVMPILADIVRNFDVLAIQELRSTDQSIVPRFLEMVNSTGRKYRSLVGPRQGYTVSTEQYVYLYDSERIKAIGNHYVAGDISGKLHRSPLVAQFQFEPAVVDEQGRRTPIPKPATQPGFSFVLMNIHVDPNEVAVEHPVLAEVIDGVRATHPEEDDFFLVGDLNAPPRYFNSFPWMQNQFAAIADGVPTKPRQKKGIDNIVFDAIKTAEYTGQSGVVNIQNEYNLTLEEALLVSDHYPVWGVFRAIEVPGVTTLTQDPPVVR